MYGVDLAGKSAGFADHIGCNIDHIGVVTEAAYQCVIADTAIQYVGGGIANQGVVERVAGGVDCGAACEHELFEVGTQRPADGRLYSVDLAGKSADFADHIGCNIDHIGVVTEAAYQCVIADTAIQYVSDSIAYYCVVEVTAYGVLNRTAVSDI